MIAVNLGDEFGAWLDRICTTEVPPSSVIAFNIGLFETEGGYAAYLSGADTFDERDNEWACDETFTPTERYFAIPSFTEGEDWQEVQDSVAVAAKKFLSSPAGGRSFLSAAQAITVGFDDGDLIRIK